MERGYKYRIYPTPEQEVQIQKTFGCVRFVFNYFLALRKDLYVSEKKSISYKETSAILTQMKQKLCPVGVHHRGEIDKAGNLRSDSENPLPKCPMGIRQGENVNVRTFHCEPPRLSLRL